LGGATDGNPAPSADQGPEPEPEPLSEPIKQTHRGKRIVAVRAHDRQDSGELGAEAAPEAKTKRDRRREIVDGRAMAERQVKVEDEAEPGKGRVLQTEREQRPGTYRRWRRAHSA